VSHKKSQVIIKVIENRVEVPGRCALILRERWHCLWKKCL